LAPQYEVVAHPAFTNADFGNGDTGWSVTGDVHFENGTAILKEDRGARHRPPRLSVQRRQL
jgi:hypothetical protein